MSVLRTVVVVVVIEILGGLIFIYSGWFDVAASSGHSPLVRWILDTTFDHSVEAHSAGISPPSLDDPALIEQGFKRYDRHCAGCHGTPGHSETFMQKSLTPRPPALDKQGNLAQESAAQAFWVIKHGVKMTAMPAWEVEYSDDQIWQLVAFLKKLPSLSPEEYQKLKQAEQIGSSQPAPSTSD